MKYNICLSFLLLLAFSYRVSAQKMDAISKDLTIFISQISYPPALKAKRISTLTTLKMSVQNGVITDISLSDSADSLYKQAFELAKQKLNTRDIEQNLKTNKIDKADILTLICVSVRGNNDLIALKDRQSYKLNKFNGKDFIGMATILPPINPFITIISDSVK